MKNYIINTREIICFSIIAVEYYISNSIILFVDNPMRK